MTDHGAENLDVFNRARQRFLEDVAAFELKEIGRDTAVVVVTHLLSDRPVLLEVLGKHLEVRHVFGIPYSTDRRVADWIDIRFPLTEASLEQLIEGSCIIEKLQAKDRKTVLVEIGGYSSTRLNMDGSVPPSFCGVVEGTESGTSAHRRFEPLNYPVVALSLSPTKAAESNLVGTGCLVSTARILRELGYSNELRTVCVLGFGRVGQSVARASRDAGFDVVVYDTSFDKRIQALGEGFRIPERLDALKAGEIIFGATGVQSWTTQDLAAMQSGAFLVSCSSKDVEFGFLGLRSEYGASKLSDAVHQVRVRGTTINILCEGTPVNFRDGASVGPLLTLLQAELIGSCADLLLNRVQRGIHSPRDDLRQRVAAAWKGHYIDPVSGWYHNRFGTLI